MNLGLATSVQIVAINEPADCKTIVHLTRYDSTPWRFPGTILESERSLTINGDDVQIIHNEPLNQLPWQDLDIDVVLECSGHL
jgi:glyceraldehyde-3-phosphate dehydrogenase/erythrose-4-phosphate dehydrogenase